MKRRNLTARIITVVLAGGLAALSPADDRSRAEEVRAAVEQQLAKWVTNPEGGKPVVRVTPSANATDTALGLFRSIVVESSPAMVKGRSKFRSFQASATGVQVEVTKLMKDGELAFVSTKSQSVTFVASPDDFQYLLERGNDSRKMNLKVRFETSKVHVTGNWKLFVFQGPMDLVGSFKIQSGDQVHVVVDSLKINDRNAPPSVIRQFEAKLNPLLDTSDLLFSPKLKTLKIDGQKLTLSSD